MTNKQKSVSMLFCIMVLFLPTLSFAQFYTEAPVCIFDIDFGDNSIGQLRYYGYSPSEEEFWIEIFTSAYFNYQIDPPESLIPMSYSHLEDNTDLHEFVRFSMKENNITVCNTFYTNGFGGFTYIVNYSFDNYKTFGFISMASTGYVSSVSRPTQPNITPAAVTYKIVTGQAHYFVPQDELRKRINLQGYNDIVSWLRYNSINVVESTNVPFDRLTNVLVNNFRLEKNAAENEIKNIGDTIKYRWLISNNGQVTEWIIFQVAR